MYLIRFVLALAFAAGLLTAPSAASAYSVFIHDRIPDVLAGNATAETKASLPDDEGLEDLRMRFYKAASAITDATTRARFLQRYPTKESFDATAFKLLFGNAATQPTLGFDSYEAVAATADVGKDPRGPVQPNVSYSLLDWLRTGSIYPDLDRRNQGRWWVVDGEFKVAPNGKKIPHDPIVLNMGNVEGLSGQAHAHYGLNRNPKSQEVEVLKNTPADFAVPVGFPEAEVKTFAPQRAQAYGDLARFALAQDQPALAALYAGNAFHYLGDLGNQIHTIQVGLYDFFVDATLQAWKLKIVTLGGLFGKTMSRNEIGIDIISNHHTWSEEMLRIALKRADAKQPVHPSVASSTQILKTNPDVSAAWLPSVTSDTALESLSYSIISAGNEEGPEIYRFARELTIGAMRKAGYTIDFDHASDETVLAHLVEEPNPEQLQAFYDLEKAGVARAATALALWWNTRFVKPSAQETEALVSRLVRDALDELEAAEQRRAVWVDAYGTTQHEE